MPIPGQNDFLLPFLETLRDGQQRTRGQMIYALGKHFNLSEADLQATSGPHFTVINRVAWCDAYFVKAGFVQKAQHHQDSMQDAFSITSLGLRELHRNAGQIGVGYLQRFYQGRVYRGAGSDDTESEAELTLFQVFEALPPPFEVFHSVKWITHHSKKHGSIGEADFIIAHPDHGVLVLEVKGGEVFIEREGNHSQWYSRSRTGRVYSISDPCKQAERSRWALKEWLAESDSTNGYRYAIFPAIALPDSRILEDIRPDCPQHIGIDMSHLGDLRGRLLDIFAYWEQRADQDNQRMDGREAVRALVDLLVPTRTLRPRIADVFERERKKIDELTKQQYTVLRMLRRHRRAAIVGGAGTGKTLLAMEKAQQLLESGFRVLFLCYNRNLGDWLSRNLQHENLFVGTYHSLVGKAIHWARLGGLPRMNWETFSQKAPDLLMDAASIIRSADGDADEYLFDAVIVDEAQDFEAHWWIPLPELLKDPEDGIFYVFFDDNQRIYTQIANVPIEGEPFYLDENCRNTQGIHAALLPYTVTQEETVCLGPEGRPVEMIPADDDKAANDALKRLLLRLVNEEGVDPGDIVILTPRSESRSQWKSSDMLGTLMLNWEETGSPNTVRVCTIYSFKGLESPVIILTEMERTKEAISNQLVYVGLSRARHHVVVIGSLPDPVL